MDSSRKTMHEIDFEPMECCIPQETTIKDVRLAAAYVPFQSLCNLYYPMEALKHGTIFPELYSPYEGRRGDKL
jgi:hypothetical protein